MFYSAINIGMEGVSCAVLLVLALLQMSKPSKNWQDKLFILVLLVCLFQTACDVAAWWLSDMPGAPALFAARAANFMLHSSVTFSIFFFLLYVYVYISPKAKNSVVQTRPLWLLGALSIFHLILSVMNLWNGMLYSIDENNHYHWGDGYLAQYAIIWAQYLIVILVIISWRNSLKRKDVWAFLSFAALPGISALFTFWRMELMLQYPAMMLSLLLIYATVQKEQEKHLALELQDSRIATMISQIQPHFLYNSLLAIQDLCGRDAALAEKTVGEFSEYLRGNLTALTWKAPIVFEKELEHVQTYVSLEKIRFEERLRVVYDIQAGGFFLPPLTVQPIVENAIGHGIMQRVEGGTVTIRARKDETHCRITVEDDGVGFDPAERVSDGNSHVGIANVRYRLEKLCGGTLTIESTPGVGTVATISIPKGGDVS